MTTKQAIEASIRHHEENLRELKKKGKFEKGYYYFIIGKKEIWYDDTHCALCEIFAYCDDCPLAKSGNKCSNETSTWKKLNKAATRKEAISAEKEMIEVLRRLL